MREDHRSWTLNSSPSTTSRSRRRSRKVVARRFSECVCCKLFMNIATRHTTRPTAALLVSLSCSPPLLHANDHRLLPFSVLLCAARVFLCGVPLLLPSMRATGRHCHAAAVLLGVVLLCFVVALGVCANVPSNQRTPVRKAAQFGWQRSKQCGSPVCWLMRY